MASSSAAKFVARCLVGAAAQETCDSNFRLIMVKALFGLMQEGLVFQRLRSTIRSSLCPGQAGYIRDVADTHLLLHEVTAEFFNSGRPLWSAAGDFAKAFPRTWRETLLEESHTDAGISRGMYALLWMQAYT